MRAPAATVLATGLLLALPSGVGAASQQVAATPESTFTPAEVTVSPGDTVTFHNNGGFHNVPVEDGGLDSPADPSPTSWTASRTFTAAGEYRFYCEQHGGPGGVGMSGVVRVGTSGGAPPDTAPPVLSSLALRRARGRAVAVVLRSSEAGSAAITLSRRTRGRYRKVRGLRKSVAAGRTSITIKRTSRGRRLQPGRYRVVVRVTDAAGNRSRSYRAGLRLRR